MKGLKRLACRDDGPLTECLGGDKGGTAMRHSSIAPAFIGGTRLLGWKLRLAGALPWYRTGLWGWERVGSEWGIVGVQGGC